MDSDIQISLVEIIRALARSAVREAHRRAREVKAVLQHERSIEDQVVVCGRRSSVRASRRLDRRDEGIGEERAKLRTPAPPRERSAALRIAVPDADFQKTSDAVGE